MLVVCADVDDVDDDDDDDDGRRLDAGQPYSDNSAADSDVPPCVVDASSEEISVNEAAMVRRPSSRVRYVVDRDDGGYGDEPTAVRQHGVERTQRGRDDATARRQVKHSYCTSTVNAAVRMGVDLYSALGGDEGRAGGGCGRGSTPPHAVGVLGY